MISRYLVILLALVAAGLQVSRGAWLEATGLGCLAGGLVLLRLAALRPALRSAAYVLFGATAVVMAVVFARRF